MSDIDARLRQSLERLAVDATTPGVASDDIMETLSRRKRARHQTRRRAVVYTAVVLLGGAMAATVATLNQHNDQTQVLTEPEPIDDPPSPGPDPEHEATTPPDDGATTSQSGSEAPLSPRQHVATAWTGSELVLWGGSEAHQTDGAAYDPVTDTWRMIAPSPFDPSLPGLPTAVWTGHEVLVFQANKAAAWNPESNEWRELPDLPGRVSQAVMTGNEVVISGLPSTGSSPDVVAALDLATDTWRALPRAGNFEEINIVWTGEELVVLGREDGVLWGSLTGRALDLTTNTWRDLPPAPMKNRGFGATWVTDRIIAVNYESEAATYDPTTDTWTELADLPISFGEVWTTPIAVGEHVVIDGGGLVFAGDRFGHWIPTGPQSQWHSRTATAGPESVFVIVLQQTGADGGPVHHPPLVQHHSLDDLLKPDVIWLEGNSLVLSEQVQFDHAEVIGGPSGLLGTMTTVVVQGERCTIELRYGTTVVNDVGEPTEIKPDHSAATWTGYLLNSGRTLRLPVGGIWLECSQPDHTLFLARQIVLGPRAVEQLRAAEHSTRVRDRMEAERPGG